MYAYYLCCVNTVIRYRENKISRASQAYSRPKVIQVNRVVHHEDSEGGKHDQRHAYLQNLQLSKAHFSVADKFSRYRESVF